MDNELEKEIKDILREADKFDHLIFCCDCEECKVDQSNVLKQILALVDREIEQAKQQLRAQAPNLIEEAKEEERERIRGLATPTKEVGSDGNFVQYYRVPGWVLREVSK